MSIQPEPRAGWILLIGPGESTRPLPSLLRGYPARGEMGPSDPIRVLEDLAELFCDFPEKGRLLLDSDALRLEDCGLLQAFLARRPGFELELLGGDPGSAAARRLTRLPRARFWPAPLDLFGLQALLEEPAGAPAALVQSPAKAPAEAPLPHRSEAPALRASGGPGVPAEVQSEVERILGSPRRPARRPRPALPGEGEPPPGANDDPRPVASAPGGAAVPGPRPPAPYFHEQVSDLRDFVQRLELSAARLRESAEAALAEASPGRGLELSRGMDALEVETLRLAHFTRTLGYVARSPGQGNQRIELAGLLHEISLAPPAEGAGRLETSLEEGLWVRADKALLTLALDALLVLATRCAGPEGVVRIAGRHDAGDSQIRLELSFPAGPLAGLPLERLFEPYALRRSLPELGPNALAAAASIVQGQGGSLFLAPGRGGHLRLALVLPAAEG